jgi:hypothetical protein
MNEWYEDVLNAGNLDEDTPHEEGLPPDENDTETYALVEKEVGK